GRAARPARPGLGEKLNNWRALAGRCRLHYAASSQEDAMINPHWSRSHASIALGAAIVSAAATYFAMTFVAPTRGPTQPPTQRISVMTQALADIPGREVRILSIDLAPSDGSPPHRHPGHHVFGYVIEGSYEWKIGDEPARILKAGDAFYEPPGVLHAVSRNAS